MALIGIGKKIDDTTLRFAVQVPFLAPVTLDLRKVANPQPGWPDSKIHLADAEVGAGWKRTPKEAGKPAYLSGHIESPVFSKGRAAIAIKMCYTGSRSVQRTSVDATTDTIYNWGQCQGLRHRSWKNMR